MILICQSGRESEIRKSGSQVKRHEEVRCRRGRGSEGGRYEGDERLNSAQIAANEGGGRGVGNRLLLKKLTWVMKEEEGEQAEKASVTQRNRRW